MEVSDRDVAIIIEEADTGQPCGKCGKCTGFITHAWRHTCFLCRCPRVEHTVCNVRGVNIRARLGLAEPEDKALVTNKHVAVAAGFSWIPPGLEENQLKDYFKNIPREKIPKIGSEGEKFRDMTIIQQWPRQDLDPKYCRSLKSNAERDAFRRMRHEIVRSGIFDVGYVQKCPKRGMICAGCESGLSLSDITVSCPKLSALAWHPECFKCETCEEQLMDLAHAVKDNTVYCGRHFGERVKHRCVACDELVMSKKVLTCDDGVFHEGHHTCIKCEKELLKKFAMLNGNHYCVPCSEELTGSICFKCKKVIQPGEIKVEDEGQTFHGNCFTCFDCRKPIGKKKFTRRGHRKICANCLEAKKPKLCGKCCKKIEGETILFEGRGYCEGCFACAECRMPLSENAFRKHDNHFMCMACYGRLHGKTCYHCGDMIQGGTQLVTYNDKEYHPGCFRCYKCDKELGTRFKTIEKKKYCSRCADKI